ncbi:ABC transporter permease, partial [Nocardia abscessus]|uniref:ABC transporter permease n=1 Tax=Nocardia abscessus TaxID=120957 RepID=UPI00245448B4
MTATLVAAPRRTPTLRPYAATTGRILRQLRNDHRTVAMILVVPALLMALLYFIYKDVPTNPMNPVPLFDRVGMSMLGILPFIVMFLITAISMQRERTSGTLERLLSTPLTKLDLLAGYGTAFSLAAAAPAREAAQVALRVLGRAPAGGPRRGG